MVAYRSETTTVDVSDGTVDSSGSTGYDLDLTVNPDALHHITISPDTSTITAGSTQSYTAQSFDQFDNPIADVTSSTAFSIDSGAGGSWDTNTYTSQTAGTWTVTGTYSGLADTATLTVNAGALHHIVVSPDTSTITAGNTQAYAAEAFDEFDNTLGDVTSSTAFSIDSGAGGSWATNVYTSQTAGTWTVTGTYSTVSDTATLTVNAGALHHIVISPDSSTITAGDTQTYTAQSFDQFNNPIANVTASTAFSIDAGAGGSWSANVYTSANAGTWTVTGTYSHIRRHCQPDGQRRIGRPHRHLSGCQHHHGWQQPDLYRRGLRPGQQHPRRRHRQHRLLHRCRRRRHLGCQCLHLREGRELGPSPVPMAHSRTLPA